MSCLGVIVGVHAFNWGQNNPCAIFGAGFICVAFANAICVIVCNDNDILRWAVHLAQTGRDWNQTVSAVSHDAGAVGGFVDCGSGGESFGNVQGAWLVHCADDPKLAVNFAASVKSLLAFSVLRR